MMSFAPLRAASLANAAASPLCLVKTARKGPNCERRSLAIRGHASPVVPLAEDGLTITVHIALLSPIADSTVLFGKLDDLLHHRIRDLFVRPQPIRL